MKETCGDSLHLGDQYMEGLLYREEARNTGSVSNGKRKVRTSIGEETADPGEWMGALGSMRPPQSIGVRVTATREVPEAGRDPVEKTGCGSHTSLLLLRASFVREAL